MSLKNVTCIEDLRQIHQTRVPKAFFDYVDHGSYSEQTMRANIDDFKSLQFRQRVLIDISKRSSATQILGMKAAAPLILAPVGLGGLQYADGKSMRAGRRMRQVYPTPCPSCLSAPWKT